MAPSEIIVGSEVWIPSAETVWAEGSVLAVNGNLATIKDQNGKVLQVDMATTPAFLRNPTVAADVTALHYIHEPGILYCLEQRSAISEPYTLLGSVLVAINPLMRIPDPPGLLGKKKANGFPHQFGIAEMAFAQMVFAEGRKAGKKGEEEIISNQSVVISGESGAGKTESAKNVLRHLVARNESAGGTSNLDDRLLSSNPILEAFGNASTLRNHNSSRFGKFLKLHFLETKRPGDSALWTIAGASVVTYLLERSRITTHNVGERGYHIFYQLRDGAPDDVKQKLGLNQTKEYRYMTARGEAMKMIGTKMKMDDKKEYLDMDLAFTKLGLSDQVKASLFQALAGVLHLGNVEFDNEEKAEGNVAAVKKGGYGALEWAAKMFDLKPDALSLMLRETEVKAGTEFVTKKRDGPSAAFARDAVAKAAYSNLFDWIVDMVNEALIMDKTRDMNTLPFIGVLDIFGFESFDKNDFEQLLINYTNEALQGTFNKQVFVAEIELYKREGLMTGDGGMAAPPDNSVCMELLAGKGKVSGLLKVIDQECQAPQANDEKMNKMLAKTFEKNPCMVKPHPKDAATVFIIKHYAGVVTYSVGRFIEKNADKVPKEVGVTFSKSSLPLVASLFKMDTGGGKAFGGASILGKFTAQVSNLIETLESSRDSFIRCVKPSPAMIRTPEMGISWFDRRYVTQQLKCLSVPQTAEVLKSGLPTRVPYEVLTENYMTVLPEEAISMWKRLGGGDLKSFMSALFYAFEVPPECYRTGVTRVFFKSGELSTLDKIMESASRWATEDTDKTKEEKAKVVKRFKFFYARAVWRKVIIRQMIVDRFCGIIEKARAKVRAANKIQCFGKMITLRRHFRLMRRGALMSQKMWRGKKGRRRVAKMRLEMKEELKQRAELAKKREEENRIKAREAAKRSEQDRLAAEKVGGARGGEAPPPANGRRAGCGRGLGHGARRGTGQAGRARQARGGAQGARGRGGGEVAAGGAPAGGAARRGGAARGHSQGEGGSRGRGAALAAGAAGNGARRARGRQARRGRAQGGHGGGREERHGRAQEDQEALGGGADDGEEERRRAGGRGRRAGGEGAVGGQRPVGLPVPL
jgi:myosin heavy subunit